MNANRMMTQGNLALKYEEPYERSLTVVMGGKAAAQPVSRPSHLIVFLAATIIIASVALFSLDFSVSRQAVSSASESVHFETVTVAEGDSLWSLAENHRADGLTTQETSDLIRSANHLSHGSLQAGSNLKVPVSR